MTQCWAGSVDRSAACCELTPSLGTVRERMRSYQPERSLYAALWCVTHMGMQACRKVKCRASACKIHIHTHTHTSSLFPLIMLLHDLHFLSLDILFYTHTPAQEEKKDCEVRGDFGKEIMAVTFWDFRCVRVCGHGHEWQNEKLGGVRRGEK